MKRRVIVFFVGIFLSLFFPFSKSFASGNFDADYDVDYAVAPSGVTIVTQKVTLTNKQTNLYARQYNISIDSTKIQNVIARDNKGLITPVVSQRDGKTDIMLTFNDPVVGIGKQMTFTLRYDNLDVAQKNGNIWEVNIPGIANDDDIKTYSVSLQVSPEFGPVGYMSPQPLSGTRWTKDQMVVGGISAAYGTEQLFALDISYFIENPKFTQSVSYIALPPDTAYQSVLIQSLEPKPVTVTRDTDGNWLAQYALGPGQKMNISAKMVIAITLTPQNGQEQELDVSSYTKQLQYWEVSDPAIQQLAAQYKTPKAIYDYVVHALSYDYSRVNQNPIRRGAVKAISTPTQAICMEFTDLFISIARAAGIPAREVVGFAYTTNSKLRPLSLVADVLHAWPEYYDKEARLWVPVDPTWGNTTGGVDYFNKLDFNHITFAIHGLSSSAPFAAGSYRQLSKTGKDIQVQFVTRKPDIRGKLTTRIQFPNVATAGRITRGSVVIANTSGRSIDRAHITIESSPFPFLVTKDIRMIPPFASTVIPVEISIPNYLTKGTGQLNVTVNDDSQHFLFSIRPMYWLLLPIGIICIGILFIVWFGLTHVRLWKRQSIH